MKLFVTGTDTDAGKTYISTGLLRLFNQHGLSTIGLKPVASGCDKSLQNADAVALMQTASVRLGYKYVNPFAFSAPIAPHIAAARDHVSLTVNGVFEKLQPMLNKPADLHLVEGAGGWYVPLNESETMADLVKQLAIPVILVITIRLGCINHALLTARAIKQDCVDMLGWVANFTTEQAVPESAAIIATLKHTLQAPCLGIVNYGDRPEEVLLPSFKYLCVTR